MPSTAAVLILDPEETGAFFSLLPAQSPYLESVREREENRSSATFDKVR